MDSRGGGALAAGVQFMVLLAVLDPAVVLRAERAAVASGRRVRSTGRRPSPRERGGSLHVALVNGSMGVVVAPSGRLRVVH